MSDRPFIIGVDFDDTCVNHSFPDVGRDIPHAAETLRRLSEKGALIILWTCRENDTRPDGRQYLQEAIDWFVERGISLEAVNETPNWIEFREGAPMCRKLFADKYIDDAAIGCPKRADGMVNWLEIEQRILKEWDLRPL